jgi:hypothetical protein
MRGTVVHNASSNLHNAVGYAAPARFSNPVVIGTDGIGGDVVEEFRVAFLALRAHDVTASPEVPWRWLEAGRDLVPETATDRVTWPVDVDPWTVAYTPGLRPTDVEIGGETVLRAGQATRVDAAEVRARVREHAERLWARL